MKKKALTYVEFYDCRAWETPIAGLEVLAADYARIPPYAEKDAWYVSERTPYSLIKGGTGADVPKGKPGDADAQKAVRKRWGARILL